MATYLDCQALLFHRRRAYQDEDGYYGLLKS